MLVITRKKGESILLNDDIEIEVVKIDNGNVKIAIKAPKSVRILRKELYVEVGNENKEATTFTLDMLKNIKK
jgi:carbon storage regulator (csrA)